jgi:hypothetical protein
LAPEVPTGEAPPVRAQVFITVEGEWTDNKDQQNTDRESEFRTRVAPGISLGFQHPQASLDLTYVPRFVLPDGRVEDSSLEHDLTFRGQWKPTTRLSISVLEDFLKSSDFQDLPDLGARGVGSGDFLTNTSTGEIAYVSDWLRAAARYTYDFNKDFQSSSNDSLAHTGSVALALTGPQNMLQGIYTIRRGEYQNSTSYSEQQLEAILSRTLSPTLSLNGVGLVQWHSENPGRDFVIGQIRVGATTALGATGSFAAQLGAQVYDPEGGGTSVTPNGLATLLYRFASLTLTASYEHTFNSRFQDIRNTGVSEVRSASFFVTSTAFRDLVVSFGGRWNWEKREQTTVAGGAAGSTESFWNVEARLRYTLARNLVLGLGYVLTLREASDPSNEYLENRVHINITYSFRN